MVMRSGYSRIVTTILKHGKNLVNLYIKKGYGFFVSGVGLIFSRIIFFLSEIKTPLTESPPFTVFAVTLPVSVP